MHWNLSLIRYEENGRGSSRQVVVGCSQPSSPENTYDESGSSDLLWQPQNTLLGDVSCVISCKIVSVLFLDTIWCKES